MNASAEAWSSCHFLDVGAADHAFFTLSGDHKHADIPVRRQRFQPLADAVDGRRSQNIQGAGVADGQLHHAARVAVDAAIGIEHVHGRSRALGAVRATSRANHDLVKGGRRQRRRCEVAAAVIT